MHAIKEWLGDLDDGPESKADHSSPTTSSWGLVQHKFLGRSRGEAHSEWLTRLRGQSLQRPMLPTVIVCVDSKAYTGFDKLHSEIGDALTHFDRLGSKVPVSYLQLQSAVESSRGAKPIMVWADFASMAVASSEDKRWALDGEALVYAVRYLNSMGTLLYYEASPLTLHLLLGTSISYS